MKTLNVLIFLLIFNTFILLGYISSTITGNVVLERISVNVTRVIDGDTVVVSGDSIGNDVHVRMLGMNTPEKKQPYHDEAMNFLKQWQGKEIQLEEHGKDKYQRTLGYIFYNGELLNKKQLEMGYANLYYYGTDKYYSEMKKAEQNARNAGIGLWKTSLNFGCIELVKLKYIEDGKRCTNNEQLILNNKCQPMNTILKDDANHIEDISLNSGLFTKNFSCVWNDDGDTLYLRDDSGLLLFYRY